MFASIPEFANFSKNNTISEHGIECLRLLNQIIADFDQLLNKPKFSSIEKIKTIGSTYMAAAGLHPGRRNRRQDNEEQYVSALARFSISMMISLEALNRHSFNSFKLKVGLNHGSLVAGVIGANKPTYDVWGDAVNIASRMESTGVPSAIHCPKLTADILNNCGFDVECRGECYVKGKSKLILTYLAYKNSCIKY